MMLITRREGGRRARYAHLSTGNYNPARPARGHRHEPPDGGRNP